MRTSPYRQIAILRTSLYRLDAPHREQVSILRISPLRTSPSTLRTSLLRTSLLRTSPYTADKSLFAPDKFLHGVKVSVDNSKPRQTSSNTSDKFTAEGFTADKSIFALVRGGLYLRAVDLSAEAQTYPPLRVSRAYLLVRSAPTHSSDLHLSPQLFRPCRTCALVKHTLARGGLDLSVVNLSGVAWTCLKWTYPRRRRLVHLLSSPFGSVMRNCQLQCEYIAI